MQKIFTLTDKFRKNPTFALSARKYIEKHIYDIAFLLLDPSLNSGQIDMQIGDNVHERPRLAWAWFTCTFAGKSRSPVSTAWIRPRFLRIIQSTQIHFVKIGFCHQATRKRTSLSPVFFYIIAYFREGYNLSPSQIFDRYLSKRGSIRYKWRIIEQ